MTMAIITKDQLFMIHLPPHPSPLPQHGVEGGMRALDDKQLNAFVLDQVMPMTNASSRRVSILLGA